MTSMILPQLASFPHTTTTTTTITAEDDDDYYTQNDDKRDILNTAVLPTLQHAYIRSPLAVYDWHDSTTLFATQSEFEISIPLKRIAALDKRRAHRYSPSRLNNTIQEEVNMADVLDTVAIETAPNSPPELSYSKSSKSSSSSLRSSSIDDADNDSAIDSPHFEELSLDESENAHVVEDNNLKPESRPTLLRRNQPKSMETPYRSNTRNGPQSYRERKMSAPAIGVLQDQSTNLPTGSMLRRGFASYSSPNITQRSPSSPYDKGSVPSSPLSTGTITPRQSHDRSVSPAPSLIKRASWQSSRKTVAQLEAEYNDDDEDVPEEAILENVPISPMPGQHRTMTSRSPSPWRPPIRSPSYSNLHSANIPKGARRPSAPPVRSPRSPHNRRPPMLLHSNTVGAFPPEQPWTRKQKAKSWNDDLNEEVRQLSAALEQYAERSPADKRASAPGSMSNTSRRQSDTKLPSKTTITELPPLQKGDIMIDPLPISKEKEAVLTRTRPSWLPPKSQKEEKKHLREWQQMMARAAEAEKKREETEKIAIERKDTIQVSIESVWEHEILLNWGTAKAEAKKQELCWQGIAPASRGAVWKKAIGNELELSSSSFLAALNRARRLEEKLDAMPAEELSKSKEYAWFSAIDRDVPAVFPELKRFVPGSPSNQALGDVLKAYSMYRSDVGYVYGTHLIAGLLCLNLRPGDAFVVLANLLNRPMPLAFLIHDQTAMSRVHSMVLNALQRRHQKLHTHLTTHLAPEEYLDPLFRCLFAYNLSATQVSRLWDVYLLEDDQILIDAAVAVLGLLEPRLYCSKQEIINNIGWANQSSWDLGIEPLMTAIRQLAA